jgi:hypothetical protein
MRSEDTPSVSAAKRAANRENAQKCTGPRTLAGRSRSSQNAFKYGRYAGQSGTYIQSLHKRRLELNENPTEVDQIEDGLRTSFLPTNEAQQTLVHEIALLQWQRRRLERAQAALVARRIQKLAIECERESLQVSQKISAQIPTGQLRIGLLWQQEDSPTKFQKLLEWLELLRGYMDIQDYAAAEAVIGWIYGPVPSVRGALIEELFRSLAEAGPEAAPDDSTLPALRLELLREVANMAAQYQLYLRDRTELTPTMREECLAPTAKQRALMSQMSARSRQSHGGIEGRTAAGDFGGSG